MSAEQVNVKAPGREIAIVQEAFSESFLSCTEVLTKKLASSSVIGFGKWKITQHRSQERLVDLVKTSVLNF